MQLGAWYKTPYLFSINTKNMTSHIFIRAICRFEMLSASDRVMRNITTWRPCDQRRAGQWEKYGRHKDFVYFRRVWYSSNRQLVHGTGMKV